MLDIRVAKIFENLSKFGLLMEENVNGFSNPETIDCISLNYTSNHPSVFWPCGQFLSPSPHHKSTHFFMRKLVELLVVDFLKYFGEF